MAVDFIIGSLLLISVTVNVLALYAFRKTPSLQTRSNAFVINLLAINVISCLVLAIFLVINTHAIRQVFATGYGGYSMDDEKSFFLDTAATLGALSLTLVIYDSHMAITDPLRYHARLSMWKVALMIAAVWTVSIAIGIASYLCLHSLYFKLVFCTLIVLAPFCLICAMYYRIFREARENGLRMRQNGSSPLLQSALNLVTSHLNTTTGGAVPRIETIMEKSPSYAEGLTLKIDDNNQKVASSVEFGATDAEKQAKASSLANLSAAASRKQSLRQMFLFGVNLHGENEEEEEEDQQRRSNAVPSPECLLNKLNNLQLHSTEVRQVRSTPDLQRYLNWHDGLEEAAALRKDVDRACLTTQYRSSVPPQTPPKHLGYMTSIRHRLSNASSLFKYREESRAARISILVVIMFLVSYIPYGLLMVADEELLSHYTATVLAIFFVVLATISSPIIFAYRNKRVQRAVKRLLRLEETTKEFLPSSVHSSHSSRMQRHNTFSVYKKNLVLVKSGPGRKMHKLFMTCPKEKSQQLPNGDRGALQNGYENFLAVDGKVAHPGDMKRNSTTSTTSTIRCEDLAFGKRSPSLLSRFGFIRGQSGNMQKYGVSV